MIKILQTLGITIGVVVAVIVTLLLLYISYILAIGCGLILIAYLAYSALPTKSKPDKKD